MRSLRRRVAGLAAVVFACSAAAAPAATGPLTNTANQWLPRSDDAEWTWAWSDSDYQPTAKHEKYTVAARNGTTFRLSWQQTDAPTGTTPSAGNIDFQQTDAGLVNLNYQSTQPPPTFPILCASAANCGNSLAGPYYMLIWGTRSPTLSEPLLKGTRWSSLGGADNDVASTSRYVGRRTVKVPAFPAGVPAVRVDSEVTQAGAIGDPYGSGLRTVYWVRGVGPVRIVFRHTGGEISQANLEQTNLKALPLPSELNLLPLNRGDSATFRWRNSKHMRTWSRQRFDVSQVVNNSSRVDVKHLSGPINVAGGYVFATRLSGVTQVSAVTKAATRAKFPPLGPKGSGSRRHFFTPYDLMVYGFNPVVPVYARKGDSWRSSPDSRDWQIYRVAGVSRVLGTQTVRTPAGRFKAVAVQSTLKQAGFRFGSGTRTSWFAPGKGLVKLVFRHGDGSVSTVERVG